MTVRDIHTTQIFAPSWWVNTYEQTCHSSMQSKSPVQMGFESSQLPTMQITELNALLVLLSMAQAQIYSGSKTLEIRSNDLRKLCTISASNKIGVFNKAIQSFPSLRLFKGLINEDIRVARLFSDETWNYSNPDAAVVYLTPTDIGVELMLGYVDPYVDLYRMARSQLRPRSYLMDQAPLRFWKSVWFDLKGLEQAILFRVEKSMQWGASALDLEGSFGCGISEIFSGLSLPKKRSKSNSSKFQSLLKILSRAGTKLHEHGMFSFASSADYLQPTNEEIGLIWKASSMYLRDNSLDIYLSQSVKVLNERVFMQHVDEVFCLILGGSLNRSRIQQLKAVFTELQAAELPEKVLVIDNNCITTLKHLFIEWMVRSDPTHEISNHSILTEYGIVDVLKSSDTVIEKYNKIFKIINESHDLKYALRFEPLVTIVSSASLKKTEVLEFLAKSKESLDQLEKVAPVQQKIVSPKNDQYLVKKSVTKIEKKSKADANVKLAEITLSNWQFKNRVKYESIKNEYLSSLSSDKRKMILEIFSRLSPSKIDEQLKNQLLKFMKENPEKWLSETQVGV